MVIKATRRKKCKPWSKGEGGSVCVFKQYACSLGFNTFARHLPGVTSHSGTGWAGGRDTATGLLPQVGKWRPRKGEGLSHVPSQ